MLIMHRDHQLVPVKSNEGWQVKILLSRKLIATTRCLTPKSPRWGRREMMWTHFAPAEPPERQNASRKGGLWKHDDFDVFDGDSDVGRIYLVDANGDRETWL